MKKILVFIIALFFAITANSQTDSSSNLFKTTWLKIINGDTLFCLNKSEIKTVLSVGRKLSDCQYVKQQLIEESRAWQMSSQALEKAVSKAEAETIKYKEVNKNNEIIIADQKKLIKIGKYSICITGGLSLAFLTIAILK